MDVVVKAITPKLPCLYCGQTKPTTGREHVVQEGLGGSIRLEQGEVCDHCNSVVFSALDGHLVRWVHDLLCRDHPDVVMSRNPLRGHQNVHRDEEHKVWLSVRLDERMRSRTPDQMIHVGGANWHMTFDAASPGDPQARAQQFLVELRGATADDLSTIVVGGCEPPVEPAIVRSARGMFSVRGASAEVAESLRRKILEDKVFALDPVAVSEPGHQSIHGPTVHVQLTIEDEAIRRALAKLALNVVCMVFGSVTARESQFDLARRFVLDGNEDNGEVVSLVEAEASRLRYATELMCPPHHHAVRIEPAPDALKALVMLYQRPIAIVRLTSGIPTSNPFAMVLVNYKRSAFSTYPERHLAPLPGDPEWQELADAG